MKFFSRISGLHRLASKKRTLIKPELKQILVSGRHLDYVLKRRRYSRHLRLSINNNGDLSVSAPAGILLSEIENFIKQKSAWIISKVDSARSSNPLFKIGGSREEYLKNKTKAELFVKKKLAEFNQFYQFEFNQVSIKNQRTCWGSCSRKKNLNFNYKIVLLPEYLADYIIVHELCHLGEFNHSRQFWNLVSKMIPDYKERRKMFKNGSLE